VLYLVRSFVFLEYYSHQRGLFSYLFERRTISKCPICDLKISFKTDTAPIQKFDFLKSDMDFECLICVGKCHASVDI